MKLSRFERLSSKKKYGFQASLSHRRPHFGLLDDLLKVAQGPRYNFLLDELSDPEPWRGSRSSLLEKI